MGASRAQHEPEYTPERALKAALRYARANFPVFPAHHAPKKSPRVRSWKRESSCREDEVRAMWEAYPAASIAIPTGKRFWVLDADRLDALRELPCELPATWNARTPRGGLHLYFRVAEGITNSTGGLPKGLDIRGSGGYVLAPPSPGYRVEERHSIAQAPVWLLELIRGGGKNSRRHAGQPSLIGE